MNAFLHVLAGNWRFVLVAIGTTVALSAASIAVGFTLGIVIAIGRTYGGSVLAALLGFYVDTMRSVPLLAILVWTYFALPLLTGAAITPFVAAVLVLSCHLAAYVAEAVRAGLTSVRPGQMRAALALGMSPAQAVRRVILPQATIRMLPAFGSLAVVAVKDSATASVIAVPELIRQTQVLVSNTYLSFQLYSFTMLVFFLLAFPLAYGVERLYQRMAHLGSS